MMQVFLTHNDWYTDPKERSIIINNVDRVMLHDDNSLWLFHAHSNDPFRKIANGSGMNVNVWEEK